MTHEAQEGIDPILAQASANVSPVPDNDRIVLQLDTQASESPAAKPNLAQDKEAMEEIAIWRVQIILFARQDRFTHR